MGWSLDFFIDDLSPWPEGVCVFKDNCNHKVTRKYVLKKTCRNVSDPPEGFLCSECGWGDFDEPTHLLRDAKFCPNCGAKVDE